MAHMLWLLLRNETQKQSLFLSTGGPSVNVLTIRARLFGVYIPSGCRKHFNLESYRL